MQDAKGIVMIFEFSSMGEGVATSAQTRKKDPEFVATGPFLSV